MVTQIGGKIGPQLSAGQTTELSGLRTEYTEKIPYLQASLVTIDAEIAVLTPQIAILKTVYDDYSIVLNAFDLENEGLDGTALNNTVAFPTDTDINDAANGMGLLFPYGTGDDLRLTAADFAPAQLESLFGGSKAGSPGGRPDNESDGLVDELAAIAVLKITPTDIPAQTQFTVALNEEIAGLDKQISGLTTLTTAPWNYAYSADLTATNAAKSECLTLLATPFTLIDYVTRGANIATRQTAISNRLSVIDSFVSSEYIIRWRWLDLLVNSFHGKKSHLVGLQRTRDMIAAEILAFQNAILDINDVIGP